MKRFLTMLLAAVLLVCGAVSLAEGEKTKLTVLSWHSESDMEAVVAGFEEAYPDIDVEIQYAAPIDDYITRFQALQATGELPDIWTTAAENRLDVFTTDYAADLKDILSATGLAEGNMKRYTDENGRVVAYAPTSWASGIAYNKTMLDEAGLEVPTDWESWVSCLNALEEKGIQALAMSPTAISDFAAMTVGVTTIWDNPEYDAQVNAGEKTYADGWTEPLQLWYDTYIASGIFREESLGMSDDDAMTAFLLGDACFKTCASWNVATINESADFEWGLIPYYGPNGATMACAAVNVGWSVNAKSPNYDKAIHWIEYLCGEKGSAEYYAVTGGLLNTGAPFDVDERMLGLSDLVMEGKFYLSQNEFKFSEAISSIVTAGTQEIMMGTATIEDIVTRMDAKHAELSE